MASSSSTCSSSSSSSTQQALPQDHCWEKLARIAMDQKAKPPGSLGSLEAWAIKLVRLQQTLRPGITGSCLLLFAADHGITRSHPGVSAYPREATTAVFRDIASGGAASSVLCGVNNCLLDLVDVGVDAEVGEVAKAAEHITVTHAKIRRGSRDMTVGPAMTKEEVTAAQVVGREAVNRAVAATKQVLQSEGAPSPSSIVICVGEVGIGNTTAAAALTAAISGRQPLDVCGRGSGLDSKGLAYKCAAISKALQANSELVASGPSGMLQAVGGLEIAAMVGAYLQASALSLPVMVDGFISGAAALVALQLDPTLDRCLFWSHVSEEKGAMTLLKAAAGGQQPPLSMGLRLGEGTGAILALPLLRCAAAIMRDMTTWESLGIDPPPTI